MWLLVPGAKQPSYAPGHVMQFSLNLIKCTAQLGNLPNAPSRNEFPAELFDCSEAALEKVTKPQQHGMINMCAQEETDEPSNKEPLHYK